MRILKTLGVFIFTFFAWIHLPFLTRAIEWYIEQLGYTGMESGWANFILWMFSSVSWLGSSGVLVLIIIKIWKD